MKILIGTQNRAKQEDFSRSISYISKKIDFDVELVFPQDYKVNQDIEETGETFAENSEIKAQYYFAKTQIPTISDDGGIIIPILGENIPGVHSKRWAGDNASDQDLIDFTLKKLEPYQDISQRTTYFQTCLTYFDGTHVITSTGETEGYMALKQLDGELTQGFPYRRLFVLSNGKYYDILTEEEHQQHNHRDHAVSMLLPLIKDLQN